MPAKFEIKRAKDGKFHFNLLASNGEIILSSQRYASKRGAQNGIASVMSCAPEGACFDRRTAKSGKGYFVLKGRNGHVIGQSEQYSTNRALENGVKSVQKNAPKAKIQDLTVG